MSARGAQMTAAAVSTETIRPSPVLEMIGVTKRYASSTTVAVQDVNLTLHQGEFVSLLGPSGCGKSTAMKMAAGLIERSGGHIRYRGKNQAVTAGSYGIVFQQATLLPWWTVEQNILLPARVLGLDMKKSQRRTHELLELVGLAGKGGMYPTELSGGMQQRVSIARALLHEPNLLFMDEPFGALDAMTRERLNFELLQVQQQLQLSVLFVTHSIAEAVLLSDRVVVMSASPGRLIGEIAIDIPKPRDVSVLEDPRFHQLEADVRKMMNKAEANHG